MPRKRTRPGAVTFVGIVLIILGCWSMLGGLIRLPQFIIAAVSPEPAPNARPDMIRMLVKEAPSYLPVMGTLTAADFFFGIAQLVCGIGLLKMKGSYRIAAILVTLGKMLFSFATHAYELIVMTPAMEKLVDALVKMPAGPQGQPPPPMPFDLGALMQGFMLIGVIITVIIQLAIMLMITLILTSGGTKAAFAAAAAPVPDEDAFEERDRRRSRRVYEGYEDDDDLPAAPKSPPDTGITDRP